MDFASLFTTPDGSDPSGDAGLIAATTELTNQLKAKIEEFGPSPFLQRLYPALPFLIGGGLSFLIKQSLKTALFDAIKYGTAATFAWRAYKVTIKGE